ncbi:MAG: pyridoxamine 5'-phosphate oxidase family protein [Thermomicrobiales bacterium]
MMTIREPVTQLDPRYSSEDATPTPWSVATRHLETAELYWLSTVRPDGRPHVTPLIAVWLDDTLCLCTGEHERKALNLKANPHCAITTGCNVLGESLDVVLEGDAGAIADDGELQGVADAYVAKYGSDWRFTVRDGAFVGNEGNIAQVFRITPETAFGFGKGPFSQTRWRF